MKSERSNCTGSLKWHCIVNCQMLYLSSACL